MLNEMITEVLSKALELRDKGAVGHSLRVAELALRLGQVLGLSDKDLLLLRTGALLHDIGKIGVPDSLLYKPASLTNHEWSIMKQHPNFGAELVRSIPEMQDTLPIILHHHERWDGTGYPNQLAGENIPFLARVCAITEVFDSLTSDQPYRAAWPIAHVTRKLEEESGKAFDPEMVKGFSRVVNALS